MADQGVPTERRIQIHVAHQVSLLNRNPGEDDRDSFGIGDLLSSPVDPATSIRRHSRGRACLNLFGGNLGFCGFGRDGEMVVREE